ncbi:hypothetical protein [Nonomuraea sp. NPDC050783]|uniref:hypothetical protein n=1 Tax=Nonomuraea sp. NPDC050783 TaxID=3154634 RepID=UPI003467BEB5
MITFVLCLPFFVIAVGNYAFKVSVPVELSGSWIGSGIYPGTDQLYTVRISLESGRKNGKVEYPLHFCAGMLIPKKLSNGRLSVRQYFTESNRCINREMELSRRGDGKLSLFRDGQVIALNREPSSGPFQLPESLVGTWTADGMEFILDNKTIGLSGTVGWAGERCILVAIAADDDSAALTVGGTSCRRHGTWLLTFRKGRLVADFKGADGRNIDGWSAPRKM